MLCFSGVEPYSRWVPLKRCISFKQSNLIDSNVALHMHLTLELSSAHVNFAPATQASEIRRLNRCLVVSGDVHTCGKRTNISLNIFLRKLCLTQREI